MTTNTKNLKTKQQKIDALKDVLIKLCDYIFLQRDNGDYFCDHDVELEEMAEEVNRVLET